jgi:anti-sigma B factor antagonist
MARFELESSQESDALVLRAWGELDLAFRQVVLDAAAAPAVQGATVVLDLSEVTFIDSSGLSVLAACYEASQRSGGRFVVRGPTGRVAYLLEVTGLAELLVDPTM